MPEKARLVLSLILVSGGLACAWDQLVEDACAFHRHPSGKTWMVMEASDRGLIGERVKIPGFFRTWSDSTGLPLSRLDSVELLPRPDGSFEPEGWVHYVDRADRKVRCRVNWSLKISRGSTPDWIPQLRDTLVGLAGVFNHRGAPSPWMPAATKWVPNSPDAVAAFLPESFVQGKQVVVRNGTWLSARFAPADLRDPRGIRLEVNPWGAGRRLCRDFEGRFRPVGDTVGNCLPEKFSLESIFVRGRAILLDRPVVDPDLSAATPWGRFVPGRVLEWGSVGNLHATFEHPMSIHGLWHCSPGLSAFLGRSTVPAKVSIDRSPDPMDRLRIPDVSTHEILLFPDSFWVPPVGIHRLGNGAGLKVGFQPKDKSASIGSWTGITPSYPVGYPSHPSFIPHFWTVLASRSVGGGQGIHAIVEDGDVRVDRQGKVIGFKFRLRPQAGPPADTNLLPEDGRWESLAAVGRRVIDEFTVGSGRRVGTKPISLETEGAGSCVENFGRRLCDQLEIGSPDSLYSRIPTSVASYEACVRASKCPPVIGSDSGLASGWILSAKWPESIRVGLDSVQARTYCQFRGGRLPTLDDGFLRWEASKYTPHGWVVPSADRRLWNTLLVWCQGGLRCGLPEASPALESSEFEVESRSIPVQALGAVMCLPLDTLRGSLPFR